MKKTALEDSRNLDLENVIPITLEVDESPSEELDHFFNTVTDEIEEWTEENRDKDVDEIIPKEVFFKLDLMPGASEDDFIEEESIEIEEDEPKENVDPWNWQVQGGTNSFLDWVQKMFDNIPKHSGKDTTGIERALAYFERLDKEISIAMRKDYGREIDADKAEQAREEIEKGMENLLNRLEKLRSKKFKKYRAKKANEDFSLVKEADTTTTGKIIVTVPYFISNIARTCIEATVQAGKDIDDCFVKLSEQYNLDNREKFQVVTLIKDMGYPILLDRLNFGEKDILPSESRVSEFQTQYYA